MENIILIITTFLEQYAAYIALGVLFFDRLAKITPTEWDNKVLAKVMPVIYKFFAILGVKVPDIESIKDGKIKEAK